MKNLFIASILLISLNIYAQDSLKYPIYFEVKSAVIDTNEMKILKHLFKNLDSFIVTDIKIAAYCDERGGKKKNDILSLQRAKSVFNFIREYKFVDSAIISQIEGKGFIELVNEENVDEQRRVNRRSEIVISYKKKPKKEIKLKLETKITNAGNSLLAISVKQTIIEEPAKIQLKEEYKTMTEFMSTAKVGDKLLLKIMFNGGTHRFRLISKPELSELLTVLKNNSKKINIQGHVCCTKDGEEDGLDVETKTMNLSFTRAKAVNDYLIENGINASRIKYEGLGGKFKTGRYNDQDRRVEIIITAE
jgi:outer membrane protein OmpA-like peptidoglycan-associated protein